MRTVLIIAAALALPGAALSADITGAWKVDSSVGTTPISINCNLVQTGGMLTGDCAPATGTAGPTALAGAVEGATAQWGYDVTFRGQPAHVGYVADIKSDSAMTGTLTLSGKPSPFTATKK